MDDTNRVLMSDSLRGQIPALEEETFQPYEDAFVLVGFLIRDGEESIEVAGNLMGISVESNKEIKIDVRLATIDAFDVLKRLAERKLVCLECQLVLASNSVSYIGPYRMQTPKMIDFDHEKKMCTLGIDLICD